MLGFVFGILSFVFFWAQAWFSVKNMRPATDVFLALTALSSLFGLYYGNKDFHGDKPDLGDFARWISALMMFGAIASWILYETPFKFG